MADHDETESVAAAAPTFEVVCFQPLTGIEGEDGSETVLARGLTYQEALAEKQRAEDEGLCGPGAVVILRPWIRAEDWS